MLLYRIQYLQKALARDRVAPANTRLFEDLQASHEGEGRYPRFFAWAKENPTEFYRIAARQLPLQIEATSRAIGVVIYKGLNDQSLDDPAED